MIPRVFAAMLLIAALYVLAVFLSPTQADELSDVLGINGFNQKLRSLKDSADGISEKIISAKEATGGVLDNAKNLIDQTKSVVDTTKSVIEIKTNQVQKVYESAEKTTQAISEFKSNVSELTSFTGATASGELSASGGVTSS